MAEQEKNKRIFIGIGLLMLLVVANLVVRATRGGPAVPAKTNPVSIPAVSQPLNPEPAGTPRNDISLPTETSGIDGQILQLNQLAESFAQRVAAIPDPLPQPKTGSAGVSLLPLLVNRFAWEQPPGEITQIASDSEAPLPMPKEIAILGEFRVNGQSKFLIKENDRVFLIKDGQASGTDGITIRREEAGMFTVTDSEGLSHTVSSARAADTSLDEAVNILRGSMKGHVNIEVAPGLQASGTAAGN